MLNIGYAQTDITPSLPGKVFLAGFGTNRLAKSVHDPLFGRVLVIKNESACIAWISLDLLGLFRIYWQEIAQRVKKSHPHVEIFGNCTHTHHGPDTMGLWGANRFTSGVNKGYLGKLMDQIESTVAQAMGQMRPARLRGATTHAPSFVKNARNPEIVDDELSCVQFIHPTADQVLATIVVYPCHPEVLWDQNPHITADYPGFLRQEVEKATHAPCVFSAGALGGMLTPNVDQHNFDQAQQMGTALAQAAINACRVAPVQDDPPLIFKKKEFIIPVTNPIFKLASRLGVLPGNLIQDGRIKTETNMLRLGDSWVIGVPGELLPRLGLEIKALLKRHGAIFPIVVGLVNDELGYILPNDEFQFPKNPFKPGNHYEETMSVGPQAGSLLINTVKELLG